MSIFDRNIASRKTIAEYVEHCARGIERVEHAYDAIDRAKIELDQIDSHMLAELTYRLPGLEQAKQEVYRRAWIKLFDRTGLRQVMDAQAVDEFRASLDQGAPAFTMDNIRSNFVDMAAQADTLFQRGIVNVFCRLSPGYKRHQAHPFEVPARVILKSACQNRFGGGFEVRFERFGEFDDIDRVIKVLDGKGHEARAFQSALDCAWRHDSVYEDDYYHARAHKNGNVHLTFKRPDLLLKINDQIAAYYGDRTLGKARNQS